MTVLVATRNQSLFLYDKKPDGFANERMTKNHQTTKKAFTKKNNNNTFEYYTLESYMADNNAKVVSGRYHWLRNKLIAFKMMSRQPGRYSTLL